MRTFFGSLVVVLTLMACEGTSDTSSQTGAGSSAGGSGSSSAGGNGNGGHDNGAGASAGGTASNTSGSSSSAGRGGRDDGTSGSSVGGTVVVIGGTASGGTASGGTTSVDARCPAQRPMGTCDAADAGLSCQYDSFSGCLCYPYTTGTFPPCHKVDPTCTSPVAPAPAEGGGGTSGKVAPPPVQTCACSASTWTCHF